MLVKKQFFTIPLNGVEVINYGLSVDAGTKCFDTVLQKEVTLMTARAKPIIKDGEVITHEVTFQLVGDSKIPYQQDGEKVIIDIPLFTKAVLLNCAKESFVEGMKPKISLNGNPPLDPITWTRMVNKSYTVQNLLKIENPTPLKMNGKLKIQG